MATLPKMMGFGSLLGKPIKAFRSMKAEKRAQVQHANSLEQHSYTVEQQRRILDSLDEAARVREFVENPVASDKLGGDASALRRMRRPQASPTGTVSISACWMAKAYFTMVTATF